MNQNRDQFTKKSTHRKTVIDAMKSGVFEGDLPKADLLNQAAVAAAPTVFEDEVKKTLASAIQSVDDKYRVFNDSFNRMARREIEVVEATKKHVGVIKERANAVAEALARIDKLAGFDFDEKLKRLERFAAAVDTLSQLNKTGRLADLAKAVAAMSGAAG